MNERFIAHNIVSQFAKTKKRLDILEEKEFRNIQLSGNEFRHIKNLTSGVMRHIKFLDWFILKLYQGNFDKLIDKLKNILRL